MEVVQNVFLKASFFLKKRPRKNAQAPRDVMLVEAAVPSLATKTGCFKLPRPFWGLEGNSQQRLEPLLRMLLKHVDPEVKACCFRSFVSALVFSSR